MEEPPFTIGPRPFSDRCRRWPDAGHLVVERCEHALHLVERGGRVERFSRSAARAAAFACIMRSEPFLLGDGQRSPVSPMNMRTKSASSAGSSPVELGGGRQVDDPLRLRSSGEQALEDVPARNLTVRRQTAFRSAATNSSSAWTSGSGAAGA